MSKPLEFKITQVNKPVTYFIITFFYEDGATQEIEIINKPKGLELNKHYFIGDLYGSPVVDDRKGL